MAIREGPWRCPRCNGENLGRHLHLKCSGCGDTRDDDVIFSLPDGERYSLAVSAAGSVGSQVGARCRGEVARSGTLHDLCPTRVESGP
jgi:hypothetical protein